MTDSVVEIGEDRFVTLVIQNHGTTPVHLGKSVPSGTVDPVEQVTTREEHQSLVQEGFRVQETSATVQRLESDPVENEERKARLLAQQDLTRTQLPPDAQQELEALLVSYADAFALDPSELGTTDVVTHSVETGDHWPIQQPVRRTSFALREKVDRLIQEMLEQQVIEPSESPWANPLVLVQKKEGGIRQVGERVFLYKPEKKTGKNRKFARPFHGLYHIVEVDVNTAKIMRVDRPQEEPILVAVDRLRRCPDEIGDEFWPPGKKNLDRKPTAARR